MKLFVPNTEAWQTGRVPLRVFTGESWQPAASPGLCGLRHGTSTRGGQFAIARGLTSVWLGLVCSSVAVTDCDGRAQYILPRDRPVGSMLVFGGVDQRDSWESWYARRKNTHDWQALFAANLKDDNLVCPGGDLWPCLFFVCFLFLGSCSVTQRHSRLRRRLVSD